MFDEAMVHASSKSKSPIRRRHFIKSWRNFNPAVLVLRGFRPPLVFRFYYAFHEAKNGRRGYLDELEKELFEHVNNRK